MFAHGGLHTAGLTEPLVTCTLNAEVLMTVDTDLFLYEEVLLLAMHDEKGTIQSSHFSYAVAGAIVCDLFLSRRLQLEEGRKAKMLVIADPAPVGVDLLDECLDRVRSAKRRARMSTWVERFAQTSNLKHRAAERLYRRGILRREEDRVLWVFPRVIYPTDRPEPERSLVQALRNAVIEEGDVHPRLATLLALTHHAGILPHVLDKELLNRRKGRVAELVGMTKVAGATREAIEAAQAAQAAAAAVAASVAVTATITSS